MRVLVVGSGGREHALAWALSASPLLTKLWVAPGNPGTALVAENVHLGAMHTERLVQFARDNEVDLVVPGPEGPLVAGLVDAMAEAGLRCLGPTAAAARLEGSKAFTKDVCDAAGIPTALWERFTDADDAHAFIRRRGGPIVVKADGLAGGKGVVVAATIEEAEAAVDLMMRDRALGDAGASVIIEECLTGDEVSLFALCDGTDAVFLGAARDHKRVHDGDTGPNTGGMGAFSPIEGFDPEPAMDAFIRPALQEMARRGTPFRGILFAGLMLTPGGARLIEYNVRFGDPECQAILPRLRTDLLPALLAACDGELAHISLQWRDFASVAVVMAAPGYPDAPVAGSDVGDLGPAAAVPGSLVFQAG
ncbi:MAG: phosphoribosylamine--glycine ligase, partial [Gemmatimonadaceae bacterium]|nr:phosphoribosylamine--glycine ligase [Acetobacteraceae bacterium]